MSTQQYTLQRFDYSVMCLIVMYFFQLVDTQMLPLGAFCTSPVSSLYTEANEAPLEERRLKLSMHYYVKTRACIDSPAHHALHEFDRTNRDLYAPRPNGRGGMTRPPAPPLGLKVEEAMTSAEINAELVCPWGHPTFHQERMTMIPRDTTSLKE